MEIDMRVEFNLFGTLKHEGAWWIAYCPPFDLPIQGRTTSEAKNKLTEACELFIVSCQERGTFDQALKELGFVPQKQKPPTIGGKIFKMAIPIPFGFEKNALCRA